MVCRHRSSQVLLGTPRATTGRAAFLALSFLQPARKPASSRKLPNRLKASDATSRQAGASSPGTMSDDDDLKKDAEPDFETLERDFQQVRPREDAARILFPRVPGPAFALPRPGGSTHPNLAPPTSLSLDALTRRSAFLPFSTRLQVLTEIAGDASLDKIRTSREKRADQKVPRPQRGDRLERGQGADGAQAQQEDQNTIASLKREIEKAWKMVDASHEKEARAKETIGQLKTEIQNLSRLVEQGAGLSVGQENTVNELCARRTS